MAVCALLIGGRGFDVMVGFVCCGADYDDVTESDGCEDRRPRQGLLPCFRRSGQERVVGSNPRGLSHLECCRKNRAYSGSVVKHL